MRSLRWLLLVGALLAAGPAPAGVKVAFDETADFSRYDTYAWGQGTPAARPQVQRWIELAIDRELAAKGLRKAPPSEASLTVVTVAFAQMEQALRSNYVHLDVYDVGVITADSINKITGNLLVDLIDPDTAKPVWRGAVADVMSDKNLGKIQKKIDKVTRKLFAEFPPEAAGR